MKQVTSTDKRLTLTVETSKVALIALDTQVLIESGKELSSPGSGNPKVVAFFAAARQKVEDGKLLCFETNQREEYLGSSDAAFVTQASLALTRGLRSHSSDKIQRAELLAGMQAFLTGKTEVIVPMSARFDVDPDSVTQLPKGTVHRNKTGLTAAVAVLSRSWKPSDVSQLTRVKKTYAGQTYQQARERELRALAISFSTGRVSPADAGDYLRLWSQAGGDPDDSKQFVEFFSTPYCMQAPKNEIGASIFADLMTSPQPLKSGDLQDSGHLSIALPVARFVITDANMRDRLSRLKLDRRWTVEAFSIRTLSGLVKEINGL